MPKEAANLLTRQAESKLPAAALFMRSNGKAWDKDSWKKPIASAVAAAGLPSSVTAYTLSTALSLIW